ncbi:porin [uncultured Ferrovibrio sp.]|jgi:hypothetical protein|uniref:porin n=1 Tax=uncultured Ferrovibrio sp. TaxID=1576913 RepID=UPI00261E9B69|nr:porin [uncultured Ferrovibrio sp.]
MKKTLLLQTALVAAAGMMLADVANAQTKAQPLAITLGGFWTQFVKFQDKDIPAGQPNQHSVGTASDAEVYFNIRGVLDDGTVIGGQIQLEAATYGDQIDERYMFIERADIGRIEIGSTDRVHGKMLYFAPTVLPGHSTTVHSEYSSAQGNGGTPLMWFANNNHDTEGLNIYTASNRYFGSKVGKGLQLGFSYTPDGCQDFSSASGNNPGCGPGFGGTANNGQLSKQYSVAANYLETLGPVDVALYGSWNTVHLEGTLGAGVTDRRQDGWQVGAQFAYNVGDGSAIQFGGGYSNEDVGRDATGEGLGVIKDREAYSVGLRYLTNGAAPGSVGIGVEYYNREDTRTLGAGKNELDYYQLGLTYQLATGVLSFAGVGVSDLDVPGSANDIKQTFGVVGIGLTF